MELSFNVLVLLVFVRTSSEVEGGKVSHIAPIKLSTVEPYGKRESDGVFTFNLNKPGREKISVAFSVLFRKELSCQEQTI